MMDFGTTIQDLYKQFGDAQATVEISRAAFDEMIERTQQFREGFYSAKRFGEFSGTAESELEKLQNLGSSATPEDVVQAFQELIQLFKNLATTIQAETERLDE